MGRKIALDTNIFIYALEDNSELGDASRKLFRIISKKAPQVVTSVITIEEILVGVYKRNLMDRISEYLGFISGNGLIDVIDVDKQIAMKAAQIRAEFSKKEKGLYRVRASDAIQIATAIICRAEEFYTADKRLPKNIDNLRIVSLLS